MKKAIVLLSGGVDSSTTLAIAKSERWELYALTFDYGQRNSVELMAAKRAAEAIGVKEHKIFSIDLRAIGGSALIQSTMPKVENEVGRQREKETRGIPAAYVPARNTIFLSIALAWAEVLSAKDIFIGVNAVDYSGYPDCRPEYIESFEKLSSLATAFGGVKIHAPLMHMSKAEIVKRGLSIGVDYSMTQSCYDPDADGIACGKCESCEIRKKGFEKAGLKDPIQYRAGGK